MAEKIDRSWRAVLERHKFLQLPAAHDALSAKLIERAGFVAYQVGGFALEAARWGVPDIDLIRFGEKSLAVPEIIRASNLPVLVDCDDGYGDVKNVAHTVNVYENLGVSAIFIEDQKPPKRCGHMAGKEVVPPEEMAEKLRAAAESRRSKDSLFIIARTDSEELNGLEDAMRRCHLYLKAGADAIYIEAEHSEKDLKRIAKEFKGVHKVVNVFEGGGKSPWMSPKQLQELGFTMALYPTTVLFRVTRAMEETLANLRAGKPMDTKRAVSMKEFEAIVDLPKWALLETRFRSGPLAKVRRVVNKMLA
ncbi:MAG: isocitrate lyase/PEP mutase family protein [Acidobacteria bacterium]|nr:isocitrate lyase/PEP mutase family protein [Acidobacteriota bacterium]